MNCLEVYKSQRVKCSGQHPALGGYYRNASYDLF